MTMQRYADYYGAILGDARSQSGLNRLAPSYAGYLPASDKRRWQVANIMAMYLNGHSNATYMELPESYRDNWVDSGMVYQMCSLVSELVTLGMYPIAADDRTESAEAIHRALMEMRFYRSVRQAVRECSAVGDTVITVGYDSMKRIPVLDVFLSGMYFRTDAGHLLYWTEPGRPNELCIREYRRGEGSKAAWGVREGWVAETMTTGLGTPVPLEQRLPDEWHPLPTTVSPVIHIPNGDTCKDGWGVSDMWNVLDLVDCYNEVMSDMRLASRYIVPPITTWGDKPPTDTDRNNKQSIKYRPAMLYWVGQQGGMAVLDTTPMLKAAEERRKLLLEGIVTGMGLCKAMLGDVGEISNRRDREVRLMYMRGQNRIMAKRSDMESTWRHLMTAIEQTWVGYDSPGYNARMKGIRLSDARFCFDDVLPQDVAERVQIVATAKGAGALDRLTATDEIVDALGVSADPAEVAARAAAEEGAALGITPAEPPATDGDQQE